MSQDDFDYNLDLVRPGKGEAKKTASQGEIFTGSNGVALATDDILSVAVSREPFPAFQGYQGQTFSGFWGDVHSSIFKPSVSIPTYTFNVSPDRLRKFSLLKPRGIYPVSFIFVTWRGIDILRFKMGPYVRGSMAILDDNALRESFKGQDQDVLW